MYVRLVAYCLRTTLICPNPNHISLSSSSSSNTVQGLLINQNHIWLFLYLSFSLFIYWGFPFFGIHVHGSDSVSIIPSLFQWHHTHWERKGSQNCGIHKNPLLKNERLAKVDPLLDGLFWSYYMHVCLSRWYWNL